MVTKSSYNKLDSVKKTNWDVVTGGPGSGKTTMVNLLKARGYKTTIENARHYFDMQRLDGKTVEEVRKNRVEFQLKILEMQIEQEKNLSPDDVVFLDRAIPDALAYYRYLNIVIDPKLAEAMQTINYKKFKGVEVMLPSQTKRSGQMGEITSEVQSVKVNKGLKDSDFVIKD